MNKICILDTNTRKCINTLEDSTNWRDHAHFAKALRNDGEIGWTLNEDNTWDTGIIAPTVEDIKAKVRARRDKFLIKVVDAMNPVRWHSMPEEKKLEWITYRQLLLDVPQQPGFPDTVTWPTKPE